MRMMRTCARSFREKMATETANIHTWKTEHEGVEHEAQEKLAETAEVRDWMNTFLERFTPLFTFTTAQRRKLATALNLRVAVYRRGHQPWLEMACNLPGIEASWHAVPLHQAGEADYESLRLGWQAHPGEQGERLQDFETRSRNLLIPVLDEPPRVSEKVLKGAIHG